MPKIYTDEFKQSALDLINEGMTQKQDCADLGSLKSAFHAWARDSRLREHGCEPMAVPMSHALRRQRSIGFASSSRGIWASVRPLPTSRKRT